MPESVKISVELRLWQDIRSSLRKADLLCCDCQHTAVQWSGSVATSSFLAWLRSDGAAASVETAAGWLELLMDRRLISDQHVDA